MPRLALLALLSTAVFGCLQGGSFDCQDNSPCLRADDVMGMCRLGWCAYPDLECESELRFSPNAGNGLSGLCVGVDGDAGQDETGPPQDDTNDATDASSSDATTASATTGSCEVPCDAETSPCLAPLAPCVEADAECIYVPLETGSDCSGEDPCSVSNCNELGECVAVSEVDCSGGGPCTIGAGVCNPDTGECDYAVESEGTICDDGSACTEGDTCDDAGQCVPGPSCPGGAVCGTRTCIGGECVAGDMPNGSSCGEQEGDRCCSGACTNIATDEENCGGCEIACAPTQFCIDALAASSCVPHPAAGTSGRCECTTNLHCPLGQECDLDSQSGTTGRCIPDGEGNACPDAKFEYTISCGDYCFYE